MIFSSTFLLIASRLSVQIVVVEQAHLYGNRLSHRSIRKTVLMIMLEESRKKTSLYGFWLRCKQHTSNLVCVYMLLSDLGEKKNSLDRVILFFSLEKQKTQILPSFSICGLKILPNYLSRIYKSYSFCSYRNKLLKSSFGSFSRFLLFDNSYKTKLYF